MLRNLRKVSFFLIVLAFAACTNQKKQNYSEAEISEASEKLNQYFEEQFEIEVQESPMMQTQLGRKTNYGKWDDFSHLRYTDELKEARKRKDYLDKIDPNSLNEETNLSYRLYKRQVYNEIEDFKIATEEEKLSYHERTRSVIHLIHIIQSTDGIMKLLSYYPAFKKDKMFSQINRRISDSWKTIMEIITHQSEENFLNDILANLRISQLDPQNIN